jgi:pimeloyl-ACP methyl ester carboxylesterase
MPRLSWDGLSFHYRDVGQGIPFIFQHGLGGDANQPFGLFNPPEGIRLLCLDCRGHGGTRPLGDPEKITIATFAQDLVMLMDHLRLQSAIVGGISLGAAVALNFTLRYPDRVLGLILSRPAWLDGPTPRNVRIYSSIAKLIRQHGASGGLDLFQQSDDYREMRRESPDAAESLAKQFQEPRAEDAVARLERIPADAPNEDRREWASIRKPTLVLASRQDPIHPFEYGETLAQFIPRAVFKEITPKSVSRERHAADVQKAIAEFLSRHFLKVVTPTC